MGRRSTGIDNCQRLRATRAVLRAIPRLSRDFESGSRPKEQRSLPGFIIETVESRFSSCRKEWRSSGFDANCQVDGFRKVFAKFRSRIGDLKLVIQRGDCVVDPAELHRTIDPRVISLFASPICEAKIDSGFRSAMQNIDIRAYRVRVHLMHRDCCKRAVSFCRIPRSYQKGNLSTFFSTGKDSDVEAFDAWKEFSLIVDAFSLQ